MSDIIHLLPDSVANQIAAGEVIQRPASVIKELVENALDAGATEILIIIKDAGRTSMQVTDNGKGMSETDARLAFERHATSKITNVNDLYALTTMGFRGEALASIAAVAQVELNTRTADNELGTHLEIAASKVEVQEPAACPKGTTFIIKNLFYNVPARRKFLKSNQTELRNIIQEFKRIALVNTHITFKLYNNDELVYDLLPTNFKQRIIKIMGSNNLNHQLVQINADTTLVKINGFVGKPEFAKKNPEQYFFVNQRYMQHPYFRRAVLNAYERMLHPDDKPAFFITLEVDPATIDVNIHPTKTEIKFENEKEIWSIIDVCVKEALGKFNIAPAIDFNTEGNIELPVSTGKIDHLKVPPVKITPGYNPFNNPNPQSYKNDVPNQWEQLYPKNLVEKEKQEHWDVPLQHSTPRQQTLDIDVKSTFYLYKQKYICTAVKSGLMMVDIKRANTRIAYELFMKGLEKHIHSSQKLLFPEIIEFTPDDYCLFTEIEMDLKALGFDFENVGKKAVNISGIPDLLSSNSNIKRVIDDLLAGIKLNDRNANKEFKRIIAASLANSSASANTSSKLELSSFEMEGIIEKLLACPNPNLTPDGKNIIKIIGDDEIERWF